jgi:hypothetical protein
VFLCVYEYLVILLGVLQLSVAKQEMSHIYKYTNTNTRTHTHSIHTCTYTCIFTRIYTYTCTSTYTYTHTHYMYIHMHMHIHIYIYIYMGMCIFYTYLRVKNWRTSRRRSYKRGKSAARSLLRYAYSSLILNLLY